MPTGTALVNEPTITLSRLTHPSHGGADRNGNFEAVDTRMIKDVIMLEIFLVSRRQEWNNLQTAL
jgi:hypothetical protein